MSVITFELKEEHIKLLRNFNWDLCIGPHVLKNPLTDEESNELMNLNEEVDLVLNGRPENFDPLNSEGQTYTPEQIATWEKLTQELPTALDIILQTQRFEVGTYKTKYHVRAWKKADASE